MHFEVAVIIIIMEGFYFITSANFIQEIIKLKQYSFKQSILLNLNLSIIKINLNLKKSILMTLPI